MPEPKRGPGRPKKKGTPSWRPASQLDVRGKKPGYVYRLCSNDKMNIQKKLAEGWHFVNSSTGLTGEVNVEHSEHASLDTAETYKELVVMALPEDTAKARREYFDQKTNEQERGIIRELRDEVRKGGDAQIHGKITIE